MIPTVFVDGIGEVGIAGGVVRVNLTALSPVEKGPNGQPVREVREQLLLTPAAVLELLGALRHVAEGLAKAGVLARSDAPTDAEAADVPAAPAPAPAPAITSPNF